MSGDAIQSVLAPAGTQASSIHQLWSLMLWVTAVVFIVTLALVGMAVRRGMARRRDRGTQSSSERTLTRNVAVAVGLTVCVLLVLLVASVWTGRTVMSAQAASAVTINVTGHQWWWEIEYDDAIPARRVLTANEMHVPVGRPVVLKVTSVDVIHSLWVPNLQGKRDLIPGYTTAIWWQANQPGIYRGQCAEFCGLQHAHMALDVVAEPDAAFQRWL